ncbi:unnamed protein product [Ixodes pacificus]
MKEAHRADVYPTPGTQACPRCTPTTLGPDHACVPKCLLGDGDHPTGDKVCQHRYTDRRPSQKGAGRWSHSRGLAGNHLTKNRQPRLTDPRAAAGVACHMAAAASRQGEGAGQPSD